MMTISSVTGTNNNMPTGRSGMNMQTDSVSKNIQNQIANAQKKLQELSSDEEMSMEEKMKKRQEIQQEITALNQQLRQHQIEQRKEQQPKGNSMDDMSGGGRKVNKIKAGRKGVGLSQASMQAMISADSSMKQAKEQGSMVTQMEGKAGVLESEIKMDKGRGAGTETKEEELADLQARVQKTTEAQISTLSDASKVMEEAAKADQTAETTESGNHETTKTDQTTESEENSGEAAKSTAGNINNKAEESETSAIPVVQSETQPLHYTPVDIRL